MEYLPGSLNKPRTALVLLKTFLWLASRWWCSLKDFYPTLNWCLRKPAYVEMKIHGFYSDSRWRINRIGFILYEHVLPFFFFKIYNFPSPFFLDIMNILQINTTFKSYLELNGKELTATPTPYVSCQTNSPSCNIYDWLFLVYLSWNICYRIAAPPLSVVSGGVWLHRW